MYKFDAKPLPLQTGRRHFQRSNWILSVSTILCLASVLLYPHTSAHAADLAADHQAASYIGTGDSVPSGGTNLNVAAMLTNANPAPSAIFTATNLNFVGTLTITLPSTAAGWTTATNLLVTIINGVSALATPTDTHIILQGVLNLGSKISIQGGTYSHVRFMTVIAGFVMLDSSVVEVIGGGTFTPASLTDSDYQIVFSSGFTLSGGSIIRVSDVTMTASNLDTSYLSMYVLYVITNGVTMSEKSSFDFSSITMTLKDSQMTSYNIYAIHFRFTTGSGERFLTMESESTIDISDLTTIVTNITTTASISLVYTGSFYMFRSATSITDGSSISAKNTVFSFDNSTLNGQFSHAVVNMQYSVISVINASSIFIENNTMLFKNMDYIGTFLKAVNFDVLDRTVVIKDNSIISCTASSVTVLDIRGGGATVLHVCDMGSGTTTMSHNSTIIVSNHNHYQEEGGVYRPSVNSGASVFSSTSDISMAESCSIVVTNINMTYESIVVAAFWIQAALNIYGDITLVNGSAVLLEGVNMDGRNLDLAAVTVAGIHICTVYISGTVVVSTESIINVTQTTTNIQNVFASIVDTTARQLSLIVFVNRGSVTVSDSSSIVVSDFATTIANGSFVTFTHCIALDVSLGLTIIGGSAVSVLNGETAIRNVEPKYSIYLYAVFIGSSALKVSNGSSISVSTVTYTISNAQLASSSYLRITLILANIDINYASTVVEMNSRIVLDNVTIDNNVLITALYGISGYALDITHGSSMTMDNLIFSLKDVVVSKELKLSYIIIPVMTLFSNSTISIKNCELFAERANFTNTLWNAVHLLAVAPFQSLSVSNASSIIISKNIATMKDSTISVNSHIVGGIYALKGPLSFTSQSFLNITENNVTSSNNVLIGEALERVTTASVFNTRRAADSASVVDMIFARANSGNALEVGNASSFFVLGNRVIVFSLTTMTTSVPTSSRSYQNRRLDASPTTKTSMMRFDSGSNAATNLFYGTVALDRNIITGGDPNMVYSTMGIQGTMKVSNNQITTPGIMFALSGTSVPTIDSCSNSANGDLCYDLDDAYICSSTAVALQGYLVDCVSATSPPTPPTTANANTTTSNTTTSAEKQPVGVVGYSEPGYVAVTGITGGLGVLGGTIDSAGSLQIAAMFSYMSCGTDDNSKSDFVGRLLLPLRISDDTRAANLIGTFILLVVITVIYSIVATLVLHIARRTAKPDEEDVEDRILRFKGLLLYPRLPFFVLLLLLPGMTIESCSLVYGNLRGGEGWEVFLGVVGMISAIATAAYCVAVGIFVGRIEHRQYPNESGVDDEGEAIMNEVQRDDEGKDAILDTAVSPPMNPLQHKPSSSNPANNNIIYYSDQDDDSINNGRSSLSPPPKNVSAPVESGPPSGKINAKVEEGDEPSSPPRRHLFYTLTQMVSRQLRLGGNNDDFNHQHASPPPILWIPYSDNHRALLPRVVAVTMLPSTHWSKVVSRSMHAAATSHRPDYVEITCGHHVVLIVLMGIVSAVDGKDESGCQVVQGFLAALCFLHAIFIAVTRPYRTPAVTPLQVAQSLLLGLLALSEIMGEPDAHTTFAILLLIASLVTSVITVLAVMLEFWLNRKINNDNNNAQKKQEDMVENGESAGEQASITVSVDGQDTTQQPPTSSTANPEGTAIPTAVINKNNKITNNNGEDQR